MQFNWIFVLIAGAAILIFFASIIIKQKSITQSSTNIEMIKQMENVIAGASISTDIIVPLEIPNFEIKISCNKVSVGVSSSQYQNLILFAPSSIKGNRIVTQTQAFKEPYRSTNLLFITSTQVRHILIGNDNLAKEINRTLPLELDKEIHDAYDASKIKNFNNYKIRFISFNTNIPPSIPNLLSKMADEDVTALKVSGDSEKGTIDFYAKKGSLFELAGSTSYIGKPSLIGAVYTDSIELYRCNMKNVFSRHFLVTKIHNKGRVPKLIALSPRTECKNIYSSSIPYLNEIEYASSKLSESSNFEISDIIKIKAASLQLSTQNKEAQKFSCPTIY